ncbi:MAG TPA: diaminobutyrate--2-oxoglutarate transaminase family protein [Steroidobacteraceae bacterium]
MKRFEIVRGLESRARTYASRFQTVFESGAGLRMRDESGREYIDCLACAGALALGHNHPEIREALVRFLSSGHVQQVLDLTTPAKFEFVEELFGLLPHHWASKAKIQFCSPSGSDAVEAAMKLTRIATGRSPIIAFSGAYHGMTGGALAAMGNVLPKVAAVPGTGAIHFAPFPYRYRCPFGTNGEQTDQLSIQYLRTLCSDPESGITKPAAVIVEVVQGEGGCIPASDEWLRELRDITRRHDIALIVDEVQTGFARTGRMFAFQHAGIEPDVLILSKALGGGYPLSVIVYDRALDQWPRGMHAGTFRGNQIAMVAGRVTMGILQRDRMDEHAAEVGALFHAGLVDLGRSHPEFGEIRGRGLMLGVEIVRRELREARGPQDGALASAIQRAAFENGLLLETGGRHGAVLRFLPPLIISAQDVGEILDRLATSVSQAKQRLESVVS